MPLSTENILEHLPHRRMEAWKWTDVRTKVRGKEQGLSAEQRLDITCGEGIVVRREAQPKSESVMGKFADNFIRAAMVITVPAGFKSRTPVVIIAQGGGHARIVYKLGKGARLCVREVYESLDSVFSNIDIQFELAQGAGLTRTLFHNDTAGTVRIVTANINAWAEASIIQHTLSFGGALSRLETRVASFGENLKADIHGAYLLKGKRHCDMTSSIDLAAPGANIRQSVKGVTRGRARGVFQGKFHVRKSAQLTDAKMRHDVIMQSDTCEIRSKPELKIYADDVACAHGNTIGVLDESALFYMRQRGIPKAQAEALLTEVFVAEAFDNMANNTDFMTRISTWLEENS